MAVVAGTTAMECQHLGGHVLGEAVGQAGAVGVDDLGNAGDLAGLLCGSAGVVAGHQHVHVAAAGCGGRHGVERRALDGRVVVFSDYEYGHVRSPSLRS